MRTSKKNDHYKKLRKAWTEKHRTLQKDLWEKHGGHFERIKLGQKKALAGSLAGMIMLTQPITTGLLTETFNQREAPEEKLTSQQKKEVLKGELLSILPPIVRPLSFEQEEKVSEILSRNFNMTVKPELEGKRLNQCYGLIGAEQHLARYPGDTMATHFDNSDDAYKYYSSGMAPGRGAWGHFTQSRTSLSDADVQREKYYIAVQTFLAPGWHEDVRGHYNFFKYRKMLVVNPENGKALVADIGDAGPAQFTGKHLGGSPEVMKYLERVDGAQKGPVLYFFIDDPENKIPLGPITNV